MGCSHPPVLCRRAQATACKVICSRIADLFCTPILRCPNRCSDVDTKWTPNSHNTYKVWHSCESVGLFMDDLPKVLVELEAQYQEQRHAFLDAAFKICWIALNWSAAQLDLGNIDGALTEVGG